MKNKIYIIEYSVYFNNKSFQIHTIRIKNCMGELHSKVRLEEYLKRKFSNFNHLNVLSCKEDVMNPFGDIFGDIFKNCK